MRHTAVSQLNSLLSRDNFTLFISWKPLLHVYFQSLKQGTLFFCLASKISCDMHGFVISRPVLFLQTETKEYRRRTDLLFELAAIFQKERSHWN